MANLSVEWNLGVWGKSGDKRIDAALQRALRKAGGDAARAMKAESSRRVRERKRFKVSRMNRSLPVTFPRGSADLIWTMQVSGQVVPVGELAPRQTRQGVTFGINRAKRSLIKGAFMATMKSGHVGVFFRRGKQRLPIDEAFTTTVANVFKDGGFIPAVHERTQSVFKSAFARLLPMELERVR